MTATMLYRAYDATGRLLHVGVSCRGIRRFNEHTDKSRWPEVDIVKVEHFADRKAALDAEARALANDALLHNLQGVPARTCGMPTRRGLRCHHTTDGGPCPDHGGLPQFARKAKELAG